MTDKLEEMFELAKAFSGHWVDFEAMTVAERKEAGRQYILDAYGELDELRRAFDSEAWRKMPSGRVAEEAADVMAYVASICITFGIDADTFRDSFKKKMQANEKDYARRQHGR